MRRYVTDEQDWETVDNEYWVWTIPGHQIKENIQGKNRLTPTCMGGRRPSGRAGC